MKLIKKTTIKPACLPGPKFQDTEVQSNLAGYGKYFRASCQTTTQGPMKNHYCITDPTCLDIKNCKPKFSDGLKDYTGCQTEGQTPAKWSRLCSRFFHYSQYKFAPDVDEVHLLQISSKSPGEGRFLETCYRMEPGERGWCRTDGNFYVAEKKENQTRIATDWGWGFCSDDCAQVCVNIDMYFLTMHFN